MPRPVNPIAPQAFALDLDDVGTMRPHGPTVTRRMSDLAGLFRREDLRAAAAEHADAVVYTVVPSPIPERRGELPQSITSIRPGELGGEYFMTKGHQHPDPQGEIYLGLSGHGGLLLYDGTEATWIEMRRGTIGYIPPGWAHRSINVGETDYRFLAVYPGSAGHDYNWVEQNGMGLRIHRGATGGHTFEPFQPSTDAVEGR